MDTCPKSLNLYEMVDFNNLINILIHTEIEIGITSNYYLILNNGHKDGRNHQFPMRVFSKLGSKEDIMCLSHFSLI